MQAREQLAVLERCAVEGVAICLLNSYVNPAHEQRLRELVARGARRHPRLDLVRDLAARQGVRPRLDDRRRRVHEGIFTEYSQELDAELRGLGFTGDLNFADCAATLLPWAEALEQPFRIVFAGPAAGTISSARLGEAIGDGNLLCADVGGTSTRRLADRRRPAVREQHVRARARPDHQRALRRDLERRRRRRQHRRDLAVRRRHGRARQRRVGARALPATGAAAPSRPSPTPAC